MVKVTVITTRTESAIDRQFSFLNDARTWLLLAGYLPIENDDHNYANPYTGDVAFIKVKRG